MQSDKNLNRIAMLYRDLLTNTVHSLSDSDKSTLLSLQPNNKIIAIGDVDLSNWCAYPLTWLLDRKLVAPTVLDESKIYQSMHAMRCNTKTIVHPQSLISQSVVIRIIGYDNSPGINDYINSFISMCIASDECKVIFIIIDGNKKFYKDSIYVRKSNSTFIETSSGKPYVVESTPLCVSPDQIIYFNYSRKSATNTSARSASSSSAKSSINKRGSCSSILSDPDMF